jgi:hypothetical protein
MTGTLCETSVDCSPYVTNGTLQLNPEDSGFGMNVLRVQQPFDFANREGHIHYTSDLRGHLRMHQAVHITPAISNSLPDLRFINVLEALNMGSAISIDFVGDGGEPFNITQWKNGQNLTPGSPQLHAYGPFVVYPAPLTTFVKGTPHDVDIYITRTRLRLLVDGVQVFNQTIPDLGFDRGYVYFGQLAYNPHKDGYEGQAGNRFMWDNFAFDGPSLPKNSLTPADKQDILFRAFNKASCTVRGVSADGPIFPRASPNNLPANIYDTWHVQLPLTDPPVTLSDILCVSSGGTPSLGQASIGDIQVVKR